MCQSRVFTSRFLIGPFTAKNFEKWRHWHFCVFPSNDVPVMLLGEPVYMAARLDDVANDHLYFVKAFDCWASEDSTGSKTANAYYTLTGEDGFGIWNRRCLFAIEALFLLSDVRRMSLSSGETPQRTELTSSTLTLSPGMKTTHRRLPKSTSTATSERVCSMKIKASAPEVRLLLFEFGLALYLSQCFFSSWDCLRPSRSSWSFCQLEASSETRALDSHVCEETWRQLACQ